MNRISWLKLGVGVVFCAIGVRLFQVQILQHDDYVAQASEQHMNKFDLPAKRGMIYVMEGDNPVPLVMNESVYTLFVDPKMVIDKKKVEEVVEKNVAEEKRVGSWQEAWADPENQYYVVGKELTRREAEAIKDEGLVGVGFQENVKRVYPRGTMAAQTLGFVNTDGVGQYGVEGAFDDELKGEDGKIHTVTDVNFVPLTIGDENVKIPAKDGKNIVLTIDAAIQAQVEKSLAAGMARTGGEYASAIVMDPNSGKILAMANLPTYNPGDYGNVEDASVYQNAVLRATYNTKTGQAYEPASVLKVLTFAAGVDTGTMVPTDTYDNTGSVVVDTHKISNANKGHLGEINFQEALDYSLNTGSVEALRRLDPGADNITRKARNALYEYYHNRFGLGGATGVELAEDAGQVVSPEEAEGSGASIRYANMTFGQGLSVTMIQLAAAYSSVVNGGEYYAPTVVAGEMVDGVYVPVEEKGAARTVVSENTSSAIRGMLVGSRNRKDLVRQDPIGYTVGAKSGTAETLDKDGNYTMKTTVATYAGFGGGVLPEYVIVVRIGGEGKNLDGYKDAGAIWTEISNYLIGYMKIIPN